MFKTINFNDFEREFKDYNRDNNFSYYGKKALFEYLEQYEEDTQEKIELDVIALCCDFSEHTLEELKTEYKDKYFELLEDARNSYCEDEATEDEILEEAEQKFIEYFRDNTQLIEFTEIKFNENYSFESRQEITKYIVQTF